MQPSYLGQQLLALFEGKEAQLQEDHSLYLPAYDLTIRPQVPELADYCTTVDFYLDCPGAEQGDPEDRSQVEGV